MMKMVSKFTVILVMLFVCGNTHGLFAQTWISDIRAYRDSMNEAFADPEKTILPQEDLVSFNGLAFFDIDPNYRVKAKFKPIKNGEVVKLKTSGSRTPQYKPYGTLSFKINKKKCRLTLYQSADTTRPELKDHLLLAFSDKSNGFETYGGGRYLDFHVSDIKQEMVIDFNFAYNPYCAYNHRFSCVIPPAENALPVKILAGAKAYNH